LRKGQSRVTSRQSPVESPVGQSDFEADRLGGWRLTTETDDRRPRPTTDDWDRRL